MNEFILCSDQLPEKGRNIIGINDSGEKYYCYLSTCCNEWRCSLTGYGLMIDIIKWKYE